MSTFQKSTRCAEAQSASAATHGNAPTDQPTGLTLNRVNQISARPSGAAIGLKRESPAQPVFDVEGINGSKQPYPKTDV